MAATRQVSNSKAGLRLPTPPLLESHHQPRNHSQTNLHRSATSVDLRTSAWMGTLVGPFRSLETFFLAIATAKELLLLPRLPEVDSSSHLPRSHYSRR